MARTTKHFAQFVAPPTGTVTSDSATVGLALTPSAVDTAQYVDAFTESFHLTPSGTESLGASLDSGTELFALTPSGTDVLVKTYIDTNTEYLALVASGEDFRESIDSGTTRVSLAPSSTDHYCPEKVEFVGELDSRWTGEFHNRYGGFQQGRWDGLFLGVGEGFAC